MKSLINVKTIIYIVICIGLVFTTWYITNKVTQDRTNKLVESINDRYRTLEDTNKKLREQYQRIDDTNKSLEKQLRDREKELAERERIINKTIITVAELEKGVNESTDIIGRIEETARGIKQIIDILPEQIILLEESDSD